MSRTGIQRGSGSGPFYTELKSLSILLRHDRHDGENGCRRFDIERDERDRAGLRARPFFGPVLRQNLIDDVQPAIADAMGKQADARLSALRMLKPASRGCSSPSLAANGH